MSCTNCFAIEPVEDQGELRIRPYSIPLAAAIKAAGYEIAEAKSVGIIPYTSLEELMRLLKLLVGLQQQLTVPLALYLTGTQGVGLHERWLSLQQLEIRFSHDNLINIISNHDFCSYLQPIVNVAEEIVGFEFLLRPLQNGSYFQPYELFEIARQTGFHSFLDRAARVSAIESSAKLLPKGIKRFINFLPSSIYNPKYCLTHTFEAMERLNQDPEDYVFEVVETEKIENIAHLQTIFAEYRRQGMHVALDDVGTGYSTVELMCSLKPDYVKIDRALISFCDEDAVKQRAILNIMSRAAEFGAKVLAEGIERREEFLFCRDSRDIGVDLAQGYLFGKPEEQPPAHFIYSV